MRKIKIGTLVILAILVLWVALKFVSSDSTSEPLQSVQDLTSSKPAFSQQKRASYSHREPKDYGIIAENNLFRPLGWKKEVVLPAELAPTVEPEPIVEIPPPPPTYTLVLTGIVQNGSDWIAIVEDQKMKEGLFLRHGEMLKDALVDEILPERITLARGDTIIRLTLGESIEYGTEGQILFDTVTMMKKPQIANETNSSSEAGADRSDNQQSLIERMRARRRGELGR